MNTLRESGQLGVKRQSVCLKYISVACATFSLTAAALAGNGSTATPSGMEEKSRWVAAKFKGQAESAAPAACLMVYLKSGPLQNIKVTTQGCGLYPITTQLLLIAGKPFERGLHCTSEGRVVVRLPGLSVIAYKHERN